MSARPTALEPGRAKVPSTPPTATDAFAVLSRDPAIHAQVTEAAPGRHVISARDADDLLASVLISSPAAVFLDRETPGADTLLAKLGKLTIRERLRVILIVRDESEPPPGADVVVAAPALAAALLQIGWASPSDPLAVVAADRLLAVSLLAGPIDQALELAADQLAAGFGVHRCLISVRGDSRGGAAATGNGTWSSLHWTRTAVRCHAAAAAAATLIAPIADDPGGACESYLAVPLVTALGQGFVCLIERGPHAFTAADRVVLCAAAGRIVAELAWRSRHDHATVELDRLTSGPGLDAVTGAWNGVALIRLTAMLVATARRTRQPVSVAVLDVIDLAGINARHGLEVGDRVLRRIADAVTTEVRDEDIVGRLGGDELVVVLPATPADGAARVAERLVAALAARPIELPGRELLAIRASVGLATLLDDETVGPLLDRATEAARRAQALHAPIASAERRDQTGPAPETGLGLTRHGDDASMMATTLGGAYRLLHEINRGGMGVVYRAIDLALDRPVAVKMLRPDLAEDPAVLQRFRLEASMLAHLQHPNLVQIYSFGHSGGDTYFVMELVEGESLEHAFDRHREEGTRMAVSDLVGVITQVASALDALHERGIVHRDVKPANVIRDPFRFRSVLVDVGIARRYGQLAQIAGTPGFVAPEVLDDQDASARSDVYGLAATVYALLTLTEPWGNGDLATILARQRIDDLPPMSATRSELAAFDAIVARGLSRDPALRPESAGAFARELAAAALSAGAYPTPARPLAPARRTDTPLPAVRSTARTRGVVFRSVSAALGAREAERLRDLLGGDHPALAHSLAQDTAPLGWFPTELLLGLLAIAPRHVGLDRERLARDIARATVRASFRRFFPASANTLVPERTLSAIRNIWGRYQDWGQISSMSVSGSEVVVRLTDTLHESALCEWTTGLLEQLVVLSGGPIPKIEHEECEACGHDACLFRVTWIPA
jgi:diguanylate cyclase (GGDEF)-like protein